MLYVCCTNVIFFLLTISSINYVSSITESSSQKERGRSDLFIYLRIFLILGITWIFGILVMFTPDGSLIEKDCISTIHHLVIDSLQVIILCFVVTDSLQGFILFWIFTFNKRVFDLYRNLLQRLRARSEARQEERERLRRRAAILRQQSLSLSVKDLEQEDRKFPNLISCWGSSLENRARKESGASQNSTSTQATTVRSERLDCHTLKEEYEDNFPPLPRVTSTLCLLSNDNPHLSRNQMIWR